MISSNKCISDSENDSSNNEAVPAVNEATNPQEELQGTDPPEESVEKLWKNKRFCCDHCRQPGDVHFRVITARHADWILVCDCLLYTSPSPRDVEESRMPSSA